MTPDFYYGSYQRDANGQLVRRGGLNECVSIYGAIDRFEINTAHPAVLASLGLTEGQVQAILERRREQPFRPETDFGSYGSGRLRVGGNSMYTLRSTARLRLPNGQLSDLRRTVAAMVKFMPYGSDAPYHVMRWYDSATGN
jgi:general secretion pathway protein K